MAQSLGRWLAAVAWAGVLAACSSNGGPGTLPTSPPGSPATTTAAAQSASPGLVDACSSTSGVRARSMWFKASDGVRLYGIEAGTGRTVVVLAHEGGADLCGWLPYISTLQHAGLRVFALSVKPGPVKARPVKAGPPDSWGDWFCPVSS